jgi:mono/diheme cytochrome c family protein
MKKIYLAVLCAILIAALMQSCKNESTIDKTGIATDSMSIAQGKKLFTTQCAACHSFRQSGIGPPLGGLTREVSVEWIKTFIKNPQKTIESGDKRAAALFASYKAYMTPFAGLSDSSLNQIIAFMHTKEKPVFQPGQDTVKALPNPIPDTIPMSNLVVELKLVTQIPPSDTAKILLTRITKMDYEPNSKDEYLLDLRGKLYKIQNDKASVYMDIAGLKPKFVHKPGLATGFGSFAFHPEFNKNGLLYTTHTEPPASAKADYFYADSIPVLLQWVLTEWKTTDPKALKFSGTSRELLRINVESAIHGVQETVFNPLSKPGDEDYGLLYIGVGDGGSVEHGFPQLAHHLDKIWGNILRIDPRGHNSLNGQYGIPATNPFVSLKDSGALGEIYARGFRNPHRITWTKAGLMLVSNVGHANIESLDQILPGHDYGWPVTEGPFMIDILDDMKKVYPLPADYAKYNFTYPVAMFDHDEGLAIAGGYEYSGSLQPALKGKFLFGDIPGGRLFYINIADIHLGKYAKIYEWQVSLNGKIQKLKDICGHSRVDLHFGRDARGEIYIMTKPDGKVYGIKSAIQ